MGDPVKGVEGLEAHLVLRRDEAFALDLSLDIEAGRTVALLGPNGAGKSTTVDLLAGHLVPDAGSIRLGGRVLAEPVGGVFVPAEERRVGIVHQDGLLFDHLDAADNVGFGPAVAGLGRRRGRRVGLEWLERFGLTDLASRRPSQLSGGQAQRVALARALATDPELLVLDEPLSALDVAARTEVRRTLAEHLLDHDGPRLLITHDPTDAFLLADRIVVIEAGRVTQAGTPADIRRHPATDYVAALAGRNLLRALNKGGTLRLADGGPELVTADTRTVGPVLATIHPNAIALHRERPNGSPRNVWPTTIASVDPLGDVVRITLGAPLRLSVDVTPAAGRSLGLADGVEVWASVKATEIAVAPA